MTRRRKKSPKRAAHAPATRAKRHAASANIPITVRDRRAGKWFEKLVALEARLRGPGGCPWDCLQTHETLRKFLIEETYEVLDAMDSGDARHLRGELGDLLLQIIFHALLAEEGGRFTISDVIETVHAKMIRRHPHVFGDMKADSPAAVLKNWEHLKAAERAAEGSGDGHGAESESESILSGIARSLPAVLEAYQLTRRASHVGFDWDNFAALCEQLDEEKWELEAVVPGMAEPGNGKPDPARLEDEAGDLLFTAVNIARFVGVDPEIALKKANRKFKRRFEWMEAAAAREGRRFADLPRERKEELWNESKRTENTVGKA